jgi:hypothetical protein
MVSGRPGTGIYQAITPFSPKKPPVGPSAGRVAKATGTFAPCSGVRKPLYSFRSVATYPGLTELTLMGVFRSSLAKKTVRALTAVLKALYARVRGKCAAKEIGKERVTRYTIEVLYGGFARK